jgi:hypothetical protein
MLSVHDLMLSLHRLTHACLNPAEHRKHATRAAAPQYLHIQRLPLLLSTQVPPGMPHLRLSTGADAAGEARVNTPQKSMMCNL